MTLPQPPSATRTVDRTPILRAVLRLVRHPDRDRLAAITWALRSLPRAKRQLATGQPPAVVLPRLPRRMAGQPARLVAQAPSVRRTLDRAGASCLQAAVVRQQWLAAAGVPVDIVVGVAVPETGFAAHAWLAGERASADFGELTRYPPPVPG